MKTSVFRYTTKSPGIGVLRDKKQRHRCYSKIASPRGEFLSLNGHQGVEEELKLGRINGHSVTKAGGDKTEKRVKVFL